MTDFSEDFHRMYKELSDPEEREKSKNLADRAKRIAARKADSGL